MNNAKSFGILYEWLQIARRPHQSQQDDLQLLMELIDIPVTTQEIRFLANALGGCESHLDKEAFLSYFVVPEEKKKQASKEISTAFKFLAGSEDLIPMGKLKECLLQEGFDENSAELVLSQVGEWQVEGGLFDYKSFVSENSKER